VSDDEDGEKRPITAIYAFAPAKYENSVAAKAAILIATPRIFLLEQVSNQILGDERKTHEFRRPICR
jgi:hypothetical protein